MPLMGVDSLCEQGPWQRRQLLEEPRKKCQNEPKTGGGPAGQNALSTRKSRGRTRQPRQRTSRVDSEAASPSMQSSLYWQPPEYNRIMPIVVVGSVAYDGVETPYGEGDRMPGGACPYI